MTRPNPALRDPSVTARRLYTLYRVLCGAAVVVYLAAPADVTLLAQSVTVVVAAGTGSGIALKLAQALERAVAEKPGPSRWTLERSSHEAETWRTSRERALSLARIHADARTFLRIYMVLGTLTVVALFTVASAALGGVLIGVTIAPKPLDLFKVVTDAGLAFVRGAQPYAAGVLSLVTLGSFALVASAYKELAVLRVELAHWTPPTGEGDR